jgi:SsrA-binding protein
MKTIEIKNKKAYHDYEIVKEYEAGIILKGYEVKSIREGKISIKESFCKFFNNELFLFNSNISKYENSNTFYEINEKRERKLLLHKKELKKLKESVDQKGLTIIPLKVYFNKQNKCKILIGLCKGKKTYDKKNDLKEKDIKRQIEYSNKYN